MPVFASRSPRRDAARRASPLFPALRFWAFPLAMACAWLLAGAFSVSALESASAAWKRGPPARMSFAEQIEVMAPTAPTRRISKARPAFLREGGCSEAARFRRPPPPAYHPG